MVTRVRLWNPFSRLAAVGVVASAFLVASSGVAQAATITVNTTSDVVANDGQCSLREAITAANTNTASGAAGGECAAGSGADTISVPAGTYTLTIATGITISADLTLTGAAPGSTVIQPATAPGVAFQRVFVIQSGATVTISGLTLRHGRAVGGLGGAIHNSGTLTLANTTVRDNSAVNIGFGGAGGGIFNSGGATLTLTNSTISGNAASTGGGIFNSGDTLTLTNSTVSGNSASIDAGGIDNSGGTLTLTNSTVSSNSAAVNGGGIRNGGSTTLTNTIVANSPSGGDCFGGGFTSLGHNLDSDSTCNLTVPTDLPGVDPLLGVLADNGGPTFTHALLAGSPAIDAGDDAEAPATDQRGTTRPVGSASDIGAFEAPAADLAMAKSASPTSVDVGSNLTYTLTVTNNGPDTASNVSLTDTLPGVVTFVSASAGCTESGGTVTCTAASLANGTNVVFTITVTAPAAGQIFSNSASVTSAVNDPDNSDNTAAASVTAFNPPSVPGLTTWSLGALAFGLGALVLAARRRRAVFPR